MTANRLLAALSVAALFLWGCGDDDPATPIDDGDGGPVSASVTIPATADNTLYEDPDGLLSNGAGEHMFTGLTAQNTLNIRRALVRFSVADSVPAGATIDSVTLELNMSKSIIGATPVALHRVSADWGEGASTGSLGEGAGGDSEGGDATWIHTAYDTSFWASPGGDFASTPSASGTVDGVGRYTWGSTPEMVADVQAWLDTPASAYGWILVGDESGPVTAKRFDTRENITAANRPRLIVHYTK